MIARPIEKHNCKAVAMMSKKRTAGVFLIERFLSKFEVGYPNVCGVLSGFSEGCEIRLQT